MEARAQLEQRDEPALDLEMAGRRVERAGEDLQQRALPSAIHPDDPDTFAAHHLQVDGLKGPEGLVTNHAPQVDPLDDAIPRARVELEPLGKIANGDDDVTHRETR